MTSEPEKPPQAPEPVVSPEFAGSQPEIAGALPELVATQPVVAGVQPEVAVAPQEIVAAPQELVAARPEIAPRKSVKGLALGLVGVGLVISVLAGVTAFVVLDPVNAFGTHDRLTIEPPNPYRAHRANLDNTLKARAKALLAGDEKGWLAPIDPANDALVKRQRQLFTNLQEMEVSHYRYVLNSTSGLPGDSPTLTASVQVAYCFGGETCVSTDSEAGLTLRAAKGGRLLIRDYEPEGDIRPWEVSKLRVKVGKEVVVVAEPKYADELAKVRSRADRAARQASRFGPGDDAGKQVIALGSGKGSSRLWYTGPPDKDYYGYAYALSALGTRNVTAVEHFLRGGTIPEDELWFILAWHLSWGAAKLGTEEEDESAWWFIQGIARHFEVSGAEPELFYDGGDVRAAAKWKGDFARFGPGPYSGDEAYDQWKAGAHVAVTWLIDRYGEAEFIAFFNAVARDGESYADAAEEHLGASLDKVASGLRKHLRSY